MATVSAKTPHALMHRFLLLLRDELHLRGDRRRDTVVMLGFALIAVSLFAIVADPRWLAGAAPAYLWTVILFSILLTVEQIFGIDRNTGRLDLLLIQPVPHWILILAKACGFWSRIALPLLVVTPVLAIMLQLPPGVLPELLLGLLLGTPTLCLIATIAAALTLGARQPTLLVMVVVLPLLVPVVIFGAITLERSLSGAPTTAPILWLGVGLCLALVAVPLGGLIFAPGEPDDDSGENP